MQSPRGHLKHQTDLLQPGQFAVQLLRRYPAERSQEVFQLIVAIVSPFGPDSSRAPVGVRTPSLACVVPPGAALSLETLPAIAQQHRDAGQQRHQRALWPTKRCADRLIDSRSTREHRAAPPAWQCVRHNARSRLESNRAFIDVRPE